MDKSSLEPYENRVVFFKIYSIDPMYACKRPHYYKNILSAQFQTGRSKRKVSYPILNVAISFIAD